MSMINNLTLYALSWGRILQHMRIGFIPPLMVYLAAGVSGLTAIAGTFVVKDYLGLSAEALVSLAFWAGLPWVLKIPLGHLVDLIWRWKGMLVFLGASLIALGLLIVYALIAHTASMAAIMPLETWFAISFLISPIGYVLQDVVADAMSVEAVALTDAQGNAIDTVTIKTSHTLMQTLSRFAVIGGAALVSFINVIVFSGGDELTNEQKAQLYADIYLLALLIPLVSVLGVVFSECLKRFGYLQDLRQQSVTTTNWFILGGGSAFAAFIIVTGLYEVPYAEEIIFTGGFAIILLLIRMLLVELPQEEHATLIGTAIILFAFRATPGVGPGETWFQIDQLGFDEGFLSYLSLLGTMATLAAIVFLLPLLSRIRIARLIVILSLLSGLLTLPGIGLYYGVHVWTSTTMAAFIDERFIALVSTSFESPLVQLTIIPLLAWIARNAPNHMKATFFAVFTSFANLALSASSLGSRYLNEVFVVTREVRDKSSDALISAAGYSELGLLLISVALLTVIMPCFAVFVIQNSRFRSSD